MSNLSLKKNFSFYLSFVVKTKTDTETLAFKVTQKILDKLTKPRKYHTWEIKESLLGLQANDVAKKIVDTYELPITWQEYQTMAKEQAQALMKTCRVCDGKKKNFSF